MVLTRDTLDAWLAIKLRIAQLSGDVNAKVLWARKEDLFDPMVFRAMTHHQYTWINRHASFADWMLATSRKSKPVKPWGNRLTYHPGTFRPHISLREQYLHGRPLLSTVTRPLIGRYSAVTSVTTY